MNIKPLLRQLNLRPSKGRGQTFLVDETVLDTILAAAELASTDTVLEIGPGLGILTSALARQAGQVLAVELDARLAEHLRKGLAIFPNVRLLQGDILTLPDSDLPALPYKVVANIPYSITSAVLRRFLETPARPSRLVLMVQKEVAQRIVATPGRMSLLALSVQFYAVPRLVATVPASAFYPVPEVDSAILRLDTLAEPPVDVPAVRFFRTATAGFSQKRKQLHNSLGGGLGIPAAEMTRLLRSVNIDESRRAETLTLSEWAALTKVLP
ncbi:MAG: 16S rRNA (adenine(1518)-N(6)/adenine(1519)-N(6))-dimethyltransferase RsmA [Chloroflexota bacterium]|nr:16S rRNA (adenine(1518)-N(6)/adenine(1519)-N(6))-dimethyltransferase RsmA [Chloroflexota bacterium]